MLAPPKENTPAPPAGFGGCEAADPNDEPVCAPKDGVVELPNAAGAVVDDPPPKLKLEAGFGAALTAVVAPPNENGELVAAGAAAVLLAPNAGAGAVLELPALKVGAALVLLPPNANGETAAAAGCAAP